MTDAVLSRAIDRCLASVRRGVDIETALRPFEALRPELDSLVLLALQLHAGAESRFAAASRGAGRNQVMAAVLREPRDEPAKARAFFFPWSLRLVAAPVFAAMLVAVVLFGLAITRSDAPSAAAQTVLTVLEGEVSVQTSRGMLAAQNGMKIGPGDRVVTGTNSRAALTFSDGSTVVLGADAVVVLREVTVDADGRLHVALSQPQGSTWTHIPQTIGQADVRIETPSARVETTQASVETSVNSSGVTTVGATSGPVSVQGASSSAVIPAGSSASVSNPGAVSNPAPAAKPERELQLRVDGKLYALVTDPRGATLGTTSPGVPVNQIAGAWTELSGSVLILHIPNAADGGYKLSLTASGATSAGVTILIQDGASDRFDTSVVLKDGESASVSFNLASDDLTLVGVVRQTAALPAAVVVPERAVEKANAVAVATSTSTPTTVPTRPAASTSTPVPTSTATPRPTSTPIPPTATPPVKQVTPVLAPSGSQQSTTTGATESLR